MLPGIAMFALMFVFLGVGVAFLCYRQLHQTSALAVGAMEESYRDTLECTEEDITDKVGAGASVPSRWAGEKLLWVCGRLVGRGKPSESRGFKPRGL